MCEASALEFCNDMRICMQGGPERLFFVMFLLFMFCFLRCSDDTFPPRLPLCGSLLIAEESRRGEQRGADAFLSGGQRTPPSPSLLLSSVLPPAFIGRASKWSSAYEKDPRLYATQISLSPPLPDSFHKNTLTSVPSPWRKALICRVSPFSLLSLLLFLCSPCLSAP